jgi:hypothetical protein
MMLVVLAYAHDVGARALVQRWRAAGERAALLTCADLSLPGWRYVAGDPVAGSAVIDGQVLATRDIRAVITRIPAVGEAELAHVHEEDRSYAAAEMQAFLLAWLMSLQCPVLNRPSPSSLGGPSWSTAQWVQRARRLGLPARPVRQHIAFVPDAPSDMEHRVDKNSTFVDVVGDRAFLAGGCAPGADESPLAAAAISLAREAGVELLRAYFARNSDDSPVFLEAGAWIDVAAESVAEALLDRCGGSLSIRRASPSEKTFASRAARS